MGYSNLLYFLAVIFVLSAAPAPAEPWLPAWLPLPLFALTLLAFYQLARQQFQAAFRRGGTAAYFAAESRLLLLAVLLFIGSVLALDLKYYLQPLSWNNALPTLAHLGGLLLFFLFLLLIWLRARPGYQLLFGGRRSVAEFAVASLRNNLSLVLPWLVLSLTFDLLRLLPFPAVQQMLASAWGEVLFFLLSLFFLALLFPPLISKLWNCTPLEPGPQQEMIETFCRSQHFSAQILSWPLLEGRALTAAVMGITPKFRYILLTPALLAALDQEELESVLAHEIGHVKNGHLLLYLVLLFGFSLLAEALTKPLLALLLGSSWFWQLLLWSEMSAERLREYLFGAAMLTLFLLYFRFLFGWFIRNFERQADVHAFRAQGSSWPLFRAFDKIASLTGIKREQKNWHHFGIGERMDFLARCASDPHLAEQHDQKVRRCLLAYFLGIGLAVWLLPPLDTDQLHHRAQMQQKEVWIEKKLREKPGSSELLKLRADLLFEKGEEKKALAAYQLALQAEPKAAETANNLAWLLLTAKDQRLRDPARALQLAQAAVNVEEKGYILDTLAEALWAVGKQDEAVQTAGKAAEIDPTNRAYYQAQAEKFASKPGP
ncbi:M48 family metalloprotease [Candidatus Electronema sp. PJ]|uniref:M48 family metallopeptidase n=1 Tax=Candidatus Electronema sp. PJ TaxID=3401572 RepID=UPI003AA82DB1